MTRHLGQMRIDESESFTRSALFCSFKCFYLECTRVSEREREGMNFRRQSCIARIYSTYLHLAAAVNTSIDIAPCFTSLLSVEGELHEDTSIEIAACGRRDVM